MFLSKPASFSALGDGAPHRLSKPFFVRQISIEDTLALCAPRLYNGLRKILKTTNTSEKSHEIKKIK